MDKNMLKIMSYNCQSFNSKGPLIFSLMDKYDIICLQETFITDSASSCYDNFNSSFVNTYTSAVRNNGISVGRPSGGLAIFWRRNLGLTAVPIQISDRLLGLELRFNNICYVLINIYCCYDNGSIDSLVNYKSIMADLSNFCHSYNYDEIIICGDFNADPIKYSRFFLELNTFKQNHSLIMNDVEFLPKNSYTYISSNSVAGTSYIDHVLVSKSDLTTNHQVLYGSTFYDHIPLCFDLVIPGIINSFNCDDNNASFAVSSYPIAWDKVNDDMKSDYYFELDKLAMLLWDDVLSCPHNNCNNQNHKENLSILHNKIIEAIFLAAEVFPSFSNKKELRIIGWNNYCKDKYNVARYHYMVWHLNGKPRQGSLFESMKIHRSVFKNALNYCRKNEMNIRKENLLAKYSTANKSVFWKEVRKINGVNSNILKYIDGESDPYDIANIFESKYKLILNDPASCTDITDSHVAPRTCCNNNPLISFNDINSAIDKLNIGLGWDNIHTNHLKYSGPTFRNLICKLFNKFLSHNYVPRQLIEGEIRPVFKNNSSSKTDSSNYRPVMNSSNILKTFENCILPYLTNHLKINNLQFGFRNNTSCTQAVTILNETIEKYVNGNSNVHGCVIDVSKAFDKINYKILVSKLRKTTLPDSIINSLDYMLNNTFVNVRCGDTVTDHWKVSNGSRQGGCLSPYLFNFYIDQMINEISNMPVGCILAGIKTNIICFADDMFLLAPTAKSLQILINKLVSCLEALCFSINIDKCKYIVFKKHANDHVNTSVFLNGTAIVRVSSYKYLGIILSDDRSITSDVDRATNSFLKQFNAMYYKFYYMHSSVLNFLFKTYTSSFYGAELWHGSIKYRNINKISVTYHKAVKKIAHLNVWDSNHVACETVGVPIFKHLIAKRALVFFSQLINTKSPCVSPYRHYLRYNSYIKNNLSILFERNYQVRNFHSNPLCALIARINYVERTEPRRSDTFHM